LHSEFFLKILNYFPEIFHDDLSSLAIASIIPQISIGKPYPSHGLRYRPWIILVGPIVPAAVITEMLILSSRICFDKLLNNLGRQISYHRVLAFLERADCGV
jgi:hypothetical protein